MAHPPSRQQFAELMREPEPDLADAALLVSAEVEPDLDMDACLDHLGELGDGMHRRGVAPDDPVTEARALSAYLADELGFDGDATDYGDPRNSFLTEVLRRRRGLPITLSIVYITVGRLAAIEAYGLNTPGHFLVGNGFELQGTWPDTRPAAVIDPFHGGRVVAGGDFVDQLHEQAGGELITAQPGLLRPARHVDVIRRLLNNLSRSYLERADAANLLWTVELKRLLPDAGVADAAAHAQALEQLGRFREAAEVCEAVLAEDGEGLAESERDRLGRLARHARSRLN